MEQKRSPNYVELMKIVLENSKSCDKDEAIREWFISGYYKEQNGVSCLCGQEHCKYVFVIKNFYNNNLLAPIGSSCMNYFVWDEQEINIIDSYEKWHLKEYSTPGEYCGMPFSEVIKNVEYVKSLEKNGSTKEHERLLAYAKAVWIHNPPPPPADCQKCIVQRTKGYKKCYNCLKQIPKPICKKCEEQKKKGYSWCYECYKKGI